MNGTREIKLDEDLLVGSEILESPIQFHAEDLSVMPSSIQVGPYTIRVVEDQAAIDRKGQQSHSELLGHFDLSELTIYLAPGMAEDAKKETLMHEILHVIMHMTGISEVFDTEQEERLICALSPTLLDTLRRNQLGQFLEL